MRANRDHAVAVNVPARFWLYAHFEQQLSSYAISRNSRGTRCTSRQRRYAKDHATALEHWWLLFRAREKMLKAIGSLPRYIACGRVTRRPIFAFIHPEIHPNDSLAVFPIADDYSFGILQSGIHWQWFIQRCSTMKGDWRYTSNTVFDSFPCPRPLRLRRISKALCGLQSGDKFRRCGSSGEAVSTYAEYGICGDQRS
jgi:hypothetical protein